jgi:hypothetical protein
MGGACFRRRNEHAMRLLVPVRRGDRRMQRRGSGRQPELGSVWIDLRLFGSDTAVEIK